MKAVVSAFAVAGLVAIPAAAQDEVVKTRQAIMEVNANAVELAYNMSEGDIPFDAAVATTALQSIAADLTEFPNLFPDDSNIPPTNALPTVWSNRAAFVALAMKMVNDATAAAADATSADKLSNSAAFLEVQKNCTACHTQFRKPLT
jgi:cytochrome c556